MFLIDTNILSYFIRGNKKIRQRFVENADKIVLCTTVQAEAFYGAKKASKQKLVEQYNLIFNTFPVLPFDAKTCHIFVDLKVNLANKGKIIEDFDLMIAATCLANDLTLVTVNTKHFKDIKNLKVENWLAA